MTTALRALLVLGAVAAIADVVRSQDSVGDLVARMGETDRSARYQSYQQLRGRKTPDVLAALRRALPQFDASAQSLGLSLILSFPEPDRTEALRGFLRGKPSLLRLGAAVALSQGGDVKATRHIVACLREPGPPPTLSLMLGRLWNIKDPSVLSAVEDHVVAESDAGALSSALRMLSRAKAQTALPKVKALMLTAGLDANRRALCGAFLVAMGDGSGGSVLVETLPEITNWSTVHMLLLDAAHLDKAVLAAVLELAGRLKGYNVRYALTLLTRHAYRPAVQKMLEWLESDDVETAKAALDGLMRLGEALPERKLAALLDSPSDEICVAAADALRRMDDLSGLPRVIALTEKPGKAKVAAVQALGKFRDPRAVRSLIKLLDAADVSVRQQAFQALPTLFRSLFPYRRFDFATTGYSHAAAPGPRRAAIAVIESWWAKHAARK